MTTTARVRQREVGASDAGAVVGILLVFVAVWVLPYLLFGLIFGGPTVLIVRLLLSQSGSRVTLATYVLVGVWVQAIMPPWCRDVSVFIASHIYHPVAALASVYGALAVATVGSMLMTVMFVMADISRMCRADHTQGRPASTERVAAQQAGRTSGHARRQPREEPTRRTKPKTAPAEPPRVETWADILGIPETSSLGEIRAAYRQQAMRWHPDRFSGSSAKVSAEAGERMRTINAAYDEAKRYRAA